MKEYDHEYRELQLYIDNDYELYRQRQSIEENLRKKAAKGRYDHKKAPKLWQYMVDAGARKYVKDFGGSVRTMFPKKLREKLAADYAAEWRAENKMLIKPGNPHSFRKTKRKTTKKSGRKKTTKKVTRKTKAKTTKGGKRKVTKTVRKTTKKRTPKKRTTKRVTKTVTKTLTLDEQMKLARKALKGG